MNGRMVELADGKEYFVPYIPMGSGKDAAEFRAKAREQQKAIAAYEQATAGIETLEQRKARFAEMLDEAAKLGDLDKALEADEKIAPRISSIDVEIAKIQAEAAPLQIEMQAELGAFVYFLFKRGNPEIDEQAFNKICPSVDFATQIMDAAKGSDPADPTKSESLESQTLTDSEEPPIAGEVPHPASKG